MLRGFLLPFSEENIWLAFKPGRFFYELSRISGHSESTLKQAMSRAEKSGHIKYDESKIPRLTAKGKLTASKFVSQKLPEGSKLMVIFDIPEHSAHARHTLRRILMDLQFKHIQHSVWATDINHVNIIKEVVDEMNLGEFVQIYEAFKVK